MSTEAMRAALDAIEGADNIDTDMRDAAILLRAALAQPAPKAEPVAWRIEHNSDTYPDGDGGSTYDSWWDVTDGERTFRADYQDDAQMLADALNAANTDFNTWREVLELIAAPMRPDGTWNRDRAACQHLAAEALKGTA